MSILLLMSMMRCGILSLLVHKATGREIIVGYKDGCYRIGLDVFCEAPSHTIKL